MNMKKKWIHTNVILYIDNGTILNAINAYAYIIICAKDTNRHRAASSKNVKYLHLIYNIYNTFIHCITISLDELFSVKERRFLYTHMFRIQNLITN